MTLTRPVAAGRAGLPAPVAGRAGIAATPRPTPSRTATPGPGSVELENTVRKLTSQSERLTSDLESAPSSGQPPTPGPRPTPNDCVCGCASRAAGSVSCSRRSTRGGDSRADAGAELTAERDPRGREIGDWRQRAEASDRQGGGRRTEHAADARVGRRSPGGLRSAARAAAGRAGGRRVGAAPRVGPDRRRRGPGRRGRGQIARRAPRTPNGPPIRPGSPPGSGLPGAHLIVDGYNVTKTGFPESVAVRPAGPAGQVAGRAGRPDLRRGDRGVRRRGGGNGATAGSRHQGAVLAAGGDRPTT